MILEPRKRFQAQKPMADAHRELVVSESFQRACESALAQMVLSKPASANHAEAVTFDAAMEGARRFLEILLNLAEPAQELPKRPITNLKHI